MSKEQKEKFTIECTPVSAPQFVKDGKQLNRSWCDHVIGKVVKQLLPAMIESIKSNYGENARSDESIKQEALAVIHMCLQRNIDRIKQGVFSQNLTCADQKASSLHA